MSRVCAETTSWNTTALVPSPQTTHSFGVSLKHDGTDGTDGPVKLVNTDGTAIERADGTAKTSVN